MTCMQTARIRGSGYQYHKVMAHIAGHIRIAAAAGQVFDTVSSKAPLFLSDRLVTSGRHRGISSATGERAELDTRHAYLTAGTCACGLD